jgi:hypothetical protein
MIAQAHPDAIDSQLIPRHIQINVHYVEKLVSKGSFMKQTYNNLMFQMAAFLRHINF